VLPACIHTVSLNPIRVRFMSAPAEPEDLASFLTRTKSAYLDAVRAGQADDWLVVFGNEAGGARAIAAACPSR
jgi:hypothetical protein